MNKSQRGATHRSMPLTMLAVGLATTVLATTISAGRAEAESLPVYKPRAHAEPSRGAAIHMGKGVNLAGQYEVTKDEAWMHRITVKDFAEIRAAGFSTIRVPVNFSRHAWKTPPYTVNPAIFETLNWVIDNATKQGLQVIIDNHVNDAMWANPAKERARFAQIWWQISWALRKAPSTVYFELLNEPRPPVTNKDLPAIWAPALAAVRKHNPRRIVVLGGDWYSDVDSLTTLQLPNDPYVVPTFHYYRPDAFTHQGYKWSVNWTTGKPYPLGRKFGSAADIKQLEADLKTVKAFIARTGRVPFIGEYGASELIPNMTERARWYKTVSSAFASVGVQSAIWGYANSFPIRDYKGIKGWITQITDSVKTTTTK
jgi:endoglucanase